MADRDAGRSVKQRTVTVSQGEISVSRVGLLFCLVLAIAAYYLWPVYGFFAHSGDAPLPAFGWVALDGKTAPVSNALYDDVYGEAGEEALAALAAHREKIGAPAMSAAVAIGGDLVWAGAVGWADIEARTAATPATRFRIGSTSKAVTASALARLVDRGVIDLDAPIGRYLDDIPNPEWATITPRMLASHSAGVPHYADNKKDPGLYHMIALRRRFDSMEDAVALFDQSPLLFPPGTDFEYSSLGTVLLGHVMASASGLPYRDLINREVLEPAAMSATIVAPKRAGRGDDIATFYVRRDGQFRPWRPVDLSHRLPGGGYASTPSDLVRMGAKWLDPDYISPGTRRAFWTPQTLSNGEVNEQDYAIGWRWREWEVEGVGLAPNANHGGVSRGSQSWLLIFPEHDMAVAINVNMNTEEFIEFGAAFRPVFAAFARDRALPAAAE